MAGRVFGYLQTDYIRVSRTALIIQDFKIRRKGFSCLDSFFLSHTSYGFHSFAYLMVK